VTVSLTNAAKIFGTNFPFSYPANVGLSYGYSTLDKSGVNELDFRRTNVAASNPVVFVDVPRDEHPNFYRVGRMPNP